MRLRLFGAVAAVLVAAVATPAVHAGKAQQGDEVLAWYDLTTAAVGLAGYPEQVTQERVWAVSWLAAARAAARYHDPDSEDAAAATALHDTLVAQVPAIAPRADAVLATSLAGLKNDRSLQRGIAAGHDAAAAVLAERGGDGLDTASVDRAWTPPPAAPGVYQLTGGPAIRAGLPDAKPFIIASAHQFDPGPPPALTSWRYLASLAEVRRVGSTTSTQRTADETDTALFWAQSSLATYTQVLREVLAGSHRTTASAARLVAAFHVTQIDQQIAIHWVKYHYLFWRPVTAIRTEDPSWTPLLSTPRHPEYPSGHAAFGGTADAVLETLAKGQAHDTFSASSTTDGGKTRSWRGWRAITDETIDARVLEGVHFRFSDEIGAAFGRAVAAYDLAHLDDVGL